MARKVFSSSTAVRMSCALPEERSQQHLLLEILTAADEEDVVFVRVQRLADRAFVDIDLDAAALKAALHGDDVAAVAVQIKDVRVQMADIEFHFSVPPYS